MKLWVLNRMHLFFRCRLLRAFALCLPLLGAHSALAHTDDLAYYLPPGEARWLGASTAEIEAADRETLPSPLRMLVLARENEQYYDRGSILLFAELGTHPFQSLTLQQWYRGMPAYGWDTYAIQPPTAQMSEFVWQADTNQRYPEAHDIRPLLDTMQQRLDLALAELTLQPGPLVLVAEGVSAALLTDLMAQGHYPQIDALVTLGAHYPQWQLNRKLATTTAQLRVPTLDLIPQHSHTWVRDKQALRSQQARRHQHPAYRQRELLTTRSGSDPRYLLHQLYGWLQSEDF